MAILEVGNIVVRAGHVVFQALGVEQIKTGTVVVSSLYLEIKKLTKTDDNIPSKF